MCGRPWKPVGRYNLVDLGWGKAIVLDCWNCSGCILIEKTIVFATFQMESNNINLFLKTKIVQYLLLGKS